MNVILKVLTFFLVISLSSGEVRRQHLKFCQILNKISVSALLLNLQAAMHRREGHRIRQKHFMLLEDRLSRSHGFDIPQRSCRTFDLHQRKHSGSAKVIGQHLQHDDLEQLLRNLFDGRQRTADGKIHHAADLFVCTEFDPRLSLSRQEGWRREFPYRRVAVAFASTFKLPSWRVSSGKHA